METLVACPLCGKEQLKEFYQGVDTYFSGKTVRYVGCEHCSLIFLQPRPTGEEYKQMYESVFQDKRRGLTSKEQAIARLKKKGSYADKKKEVAPLSGYLKKGDSYLEIGAGWGTFAKVVQEVYGVQVEVIEPSLLASEVAREYYGLKVFQGDFDAFLHHRSVVSHLEKETKYHMIALSHVFEHLTDPNTFLEKVKKLLAPQGFLFLALPDVTRPPEISEKFFHIEHCFYYSPTTVSNMLQKHGFTVVKLLQDSQDMKVVAVFSGTSSLINFSHHELDSVQKTRKSIERRYAVLRWFKNILYRFLSPEQRQKVSHTVAIFLRKCKIINV